jgi:hypothetical protein
MNQKYKIFCCWGVGCYNNNMEDEIHCKYNT